MAGNTETRQYAIEQVDKLLGQLAFQISRTLRSHDPHSVHALRVAIRRFSQALLVFAPCFPAKDVKKIRLRLGEIMAPAREVRDCDLAISQLTKSKLAEAAALRARLGRQRKEAERILLGTLKRWMQRKSSLKWRTKLQGAFETKKTLPETAEDAAAGVLPDLAKKFFDRGKQAVEGGGSADGIHAFRIAAKKFRYTLELFATLYGPPLGTWLERVRSVHALAGGIDDCAAVRKMLARGASGEAVDAELRRKQRKQMEEFLCEWTEIFASPDHSRYWIHYLQHSAGKRQTARKPMTRSVSASSSPLRSSQRA